MTTTFEKLPASQVRLGFVVEHEKSDEELKKAFNQIKNRVNIPGFRRGKAPMKVIESFYGQTLYSDVLNALLPGLYEEAIKEHDLEPVSEPEVTVEQIGLGKDLKFSVKLSVKPVVELGEYKHLGIVKTVDEVTDDDVMADIERARDRASRWVEVSDRPAKLDDQVNIDYAGFNGDEQFDGGTAQGHDLVLGSGTFIPGFEEQLVGAEVGSEIDVNVTFPEQYHEPSLAGKPVVFKVKVNGIREKEMPALDDEFVKEASETADTVEQYKAEIRERLEKQADSRAENAFENEVLETVVDNAKMDLPEVMIKDEVDRLLRNLEMQMRAQKLSLEDYCKFTGQTLEGVREMYAPQAERNVRTRLVLEAVKNAENIEASEEEIEAQIAQYAEQGKQTVEEFKKLLSDSDREYFADSAAIRKTLDFLKANAE